MSDLTPSKLDELRRRAAIAADATTERTPWYSADDLTAYGIESEEDAPYIAALAPPIVLALLAAATERDRLAEAVRTYGRTIDRWGLLIIAATRSEDIATSDGDGDWEVIESRLAEVPALLTERDALAAELAHMREARDNARAEVERLTALVEAVREDARDIARDSGDDKGCYGVDFWAGMCKAAARIDGRIRHALDGEGGQ